MISLSIVDVVFNGLFVTSIPLTTSYSLFLFKRSCGNIYLNYRNQTMDVSRLYLWIPSAALFPLTDRMLCCRVEFTSQGDRTYRRVRYNDPAVDNLLEIVSNEL